MTDAAGTTAGAVAPVVTSPKPLDLALAPNASSSSAGAGGSNRRRAGAAAVENLSSESRVKEYEELTELYNEYIDRFGRRSHVSLL